MDRKRRQVERYLKQQRHHRTREEEKEIERRASARKAARRHRGREGSRDWLADADEVHEYERIPRSPRFHRGGPAPQRGPVQPDEEPPTGLPTGLVLSLASGRARVVLEGRELDVVLAARLARTQQSSVTVGDEVFLAERSDGSFEACAVRPRRSSLSRPDPSHPMRERVLAANVDRAVIVVAARAPAFRARLIDRYLIAVQHGGVEPIVCANKADLLEDDGARRRIEVVLGVHRDLGVPAFFTSVETGEGIAELGRAIAGRTSVFVGQSGVGKSSLLNALAPELDLRTGGVREGDGKGRHTTSASTLLELGEGTRVIDTPGIRSFGLFDVDQRSLALYFPELSAAAPGCRFSDCLHRGEPDCAVRALVEEGGIARQRYDTYLRILGSL